MVSEGCLSLSSQHFLWRYVPDSTDEIQSDHTRTDATELASWVWEYYIGSIDRSSMFNMFYITWLQDKTNTSNVVRIKKTVWKGRSEEECIHKGLLYRINWELENIAYDFRTFETIKKDGFVSMYDCVKKESHQYGLDTLLAVYQADKRSYDWPRRSSRPRLNAIEQVVKHINGIARLCDVANFPLKIITRDDIFSRNPPWLRHARQYALGMRASGQLPHSEGDKVSDCCPLDQAKCNQIIHHYKHDH